MLSEIFYWVFNMSITSAVTGLLVLSLGLIKKVPRRVAVVLWAIPFLRMTIPLGMNSPHSIMTLLSKLSTKTVPKFVPVQFIGVDRDFSMMNSVGLADRYFPVTYKVNVLQDVFRVASVIWLVGFVLILLMIIFVYLGTLRELKGAVHLRDNIYLSQKVSTPAVYGIIKPRIVLPLSYENKNIEMIIVHEKMHIRRGDNFFRLMATLIVSAHWFNPLCWVFLRRLLEDMELACDECVLSKLGADRRKDYALSLVEEKESATVLASSFGGAKIRKRIENIMSFRRMTWFSSLVFTALITLISYILLTNAG